MRITASFLDSRMCRSLVMSTAIFSAAAPVRFPTRVCSIQSLPCSIVNSVSHMLPLATKRTVNETLDLPGCHRTFDSGNQVRCDNRVVFQIGDTVYEADAGPTFLLDVAFVFLYFALLPALAGATLGKALTGIRVVDGSGNVAGFGKSLGRWAVFLVDGPLTLYLCGLITSLASKGHRRLGDMCAPTPVPP